MNVNIKWLVLFLIFLDLLACQGKTKENLDFTARKGIMDLRKFDFKMTTQLLPLCLRQQEMILMG
jgi:hypothetical protein